MDSIGRTISYIATLDPDFPDQIQGEPDEDIALLDVAARRPVSDVHRSFLQQMGRSLGPIDLGPVRCSSGALRAAHGVTDGTLPPELELFGVSGEDPYQDLYLHFQNEPEPRVILLYSMTGGSYEGADPSRAFVQAGSVAEMLCLAAMRRFRLSTAPLNSDFVQNKPEPNGIPAFVELVRGMELEPLWFSTPITQVVEYGASTLIARQRPHQPLSVTLAATEPTEFDLLSRFLVHALKMAPSPKPH